MQTRCSIGSIQFTLYVDGAEQREVLFDEMVQNRTFGKFYIEMAVSTFLCTGNRMDK